MKYGIREIADVVFRAKSTMQVGNKVFYKHEPVIYFDTLKTSSLEGASTTVYATGGRGNARLIAWEGERTLTFTMEDALISATGLMILAGAGLIEASKTEKIKVHATEPTDKVKVTATGTFGEAGYKVSKAYVYLEENPYYVAGDNLIYVMATKEGEPITEPYIPKAGGTQLTADNLSTFGLTSGDTSYIGLYAIELKATDNLSVFADGVPVLVDYYVEREQGVQQIEITPETFGGNFYVEASTLFRDQNGVDYPAEFIIPNAKVQSNFTFSMASSGDPSTFTFTMDAFPGYTRFNETKKVLAAIQVVDTVTATTAWGDNREKTEWNYMG